MKLDNRPRVVLILGWAALVILVILTKNGMWLLLPPVVYGLVAYFTREGPFRRT